MAVSLLILLFVVHELSYDNFHENKDRIFLAKGNFIYGTQTSSISGFSATTAKILKESSNEIKEFVRLTSKDHFLLSAKGNNFYEDKILFADPSLFSVFSFHLISGNPKNALSQPNKMVVSPKMAKKYFGDESPIGKTIQYIPPAGIDFSSGKPVTVPGIKQIYEITGIISPAPSNSSIDYNFIISLSSLSTIEKNFYYYDKATIGGYNTYFLLNNKNQTSEVEANMNKLILPPLPEAKINLYLQPLEKNHFDTVNKNFVYIFWGIALIILFLAIINYISLTTARSTLRAKEVGIKKAIGAMQYQLAMQFFGESLMISFFAFFLSLILMQLMLPAFYNLLQVNIPLSFIWQPGFIMTASLVLILTSLLSGAYPAILLSNFAAIDVLKGKFTSSTGGAVLRNFFIIFQFSVAGVLIICSLIIQGQLDFIRQKDIGINKNGIIIIALPSMDRHYLFLKNELNRLAGIISVSASTSVPFYPQGSFSVFNQSEDKRQIEMNLTNVDGDFFKTYNIKWKEKLYENDFFAKANGKIILNEAALAALDIKSPLGKEIKFLGPPKSIMGIIKNYNFISLHFPVKPLIILASNDSSGHLMDNGGFLSVLLSPQANIPQKIKEIRDIYQTYEKVKPLEYFFLDDAFNKLYQYEDRLANIFKIFSFFAVFIACLGLFGLSTFSAENRIKEIGIRKVLGASVMDVVILITKEFFWFILIANIIAFPIAWYAMNKWLNDFAFKIKISWEILMVSILLTVFIGILTVSLQAVKAALANPVKSLRTE